MSDRIRLEVSCPDCGHSMVTLDLKGDGKITVCTRRGCKRHFIELDENVPHLDRLFEMPERDKDGPVPSPLFAREVQATVSFLASYCPHCQESLIEDDHIVFELETQAGNTGRFCLSTYLNVFSHRSTVEVPHFEEIKDLCCPKCRHTLLTPEQKCGECGTRAVYNLLDRNQLRCRSFFSEKSVINPLPTPLTHVTNNPGLSG